MKELHEMGDCGIGSQNYFRKKDLATCRIEGKERKQIRSCILLNKIAEARLCEFVLQFFCFVGFWQCCCMLRCGSVTQTFTAVFCLMIEEIRAFGVFQTESIPRADTSAADAEVRARARERVQHLPPFAKKYVGSCFTCILCADTLPSERQRF